MRRSATILGVTVEADAARLLAASSRGTPRIANRILRRMRDFAQVEGQGRVTARIVAAGLERLEIDELGLERLDREILRAIIQKYSGGPVGAETLAITVGEGVDSLEDYYEPFLIQAGLVARTSRGRVATAAAYRHLNLEPPSEDGRFLFELPEELIAQFPPERRGESRLLVLDRATGERRHAEVRRLASFIEPGTLMIFNDSRVRKARIYGEALDTGARVEFLLLRRRDDAAWEAAATKLKRQKLGRRLFPRGCGRRGCRISRERGEKRRARRNAASALRPSHRRCLSRPSGPHPPASLYQARGRAERRRAIPDRLRSGRGFIRLAHGRTAFYGRTPRRIGRSRHRTGDGHPPCGPGHLSSGAQRGNRGASHARRGVQRARGDGAGSHEGQGRRAAGARRRHDQPAYARICLGRGRARVRLWAARRSSFIRATDSKRRIASSPISTRPSRPCSCSSRPSRGGNGYSKPTRRPCGCVIAFSVTGTRCSSCRYSPSPTMVADGIMLP